MPDIDKKIFFFFQHLQNSALDPLFTRPTVLGELPILLTLLVFFILLLDRKKPFERIGVLTAGIWATHWAMIFLKSAFKRPRPLLLWGDIHVMSQNMDYSFPSGHTAHAFAAAFLLNALYGKKMRWTYVAAAWVGITRVYLGVHYPSDVLGGVITAAAVCAALLYFYRKEIRQ